MNQHLEPSPPRDKAIAAALALDPPDGPSDDFWHAVRTKAAEPAAAPTPAGAIGRRHQRIAMIFSAAATVLLILGFLAFGQFGENDRTQDLTVAAQPTDESPTRSAATQDQSFAALEQLLIGDWIESYEESRYHYVRQGADLPHSWFRRTLSLRPDGSASMLMLASDDGHYDIHGQWKLIDDSTLRLEVTSQDRDFERWENSEAYQYIGSVVMIEILSADPAGRSIELDIETVRPTVNETISGTITAKEATPHGLGADLGPVTLPAGAKVIVSLVDATHYDAPVSKTITTSVYEASELPMSFSLTRVEPMRSLDTYWIQVRIEDSLGSALYVSDFPFGVGRGQATKDVHVVPVGS